MTDKLPLGTATYLAKTLGLADVGMRLWNQLRKAEEDAELGQAAPLGTDDDQLDMPKVPSENPYASRSQALEALRQTAGMLNELLADEDRASQLGSDERERVRLVAEWLSHGPDAPLSQGAGSTPSYPPPTSMSLEALSKALDLKLSVKAIIKTDKGTLVLKDAYSDYWDLPGGHVQDEETLVNALRRELKEETGLDLVGAQERFVKILTLGSETKPVVFYDAGAEGDIVLSEEHLGYEWADERECERLNLGVFKGILIPSSVDTSVMRPHQEVGVLGPVIAAALPSLEEPETPATRFGSQATVGEKAGGDAKQTKAVGHGDDLTNPSYEASLDKGKFDTQEEAVRAVEEHHGSPLQVKEKRAGGDLVLYCPEGGPDEMWYITNDGMVFSYETFDKGQPPMLNRDDNLLGNHPTEPMMTTDLAEPRQIARKAGVAGPATDGLHGDVGFVATEIDDPTGHATKADAIMEQLRVLIERTGTRPGAEEGEEVRQTAGGQLARIPSVDATITKEGDGGGIGGSIAGPGDTMTGEEVHTPVGGSGRKDPKVISKRQITYAGLPVIRRNQPTKLMKGVKGDPGRYDLRVLYKDFTKGTEQRNRFVVAGYASPVIVDLEGHRISHEALAADLPRFMGEGGAFANANVMHSNITIGKVIPEFTTPDGTVYKTQVDDRGLFAVVEVRTDPSAPAVCKQVIEDIENGNLRSFSISGHAENPRFTCDGDQCFYDIGKLQLYELTICEEGVNQEAKFDVINKALGKTRDRLPVSEADLMKYFGAFSNLWDRYHHTGKWQAVLYNPESGEVLLKE